MSQRLRRPQRQKHTVPASKWVWDVCGTWNRGGLGHKCTSSLSISHGLPNLWELSFMAPLLTLSISKSTSHVRSPFPPQLPRLPSFFSITLAKVLPTLPTFSKKPVSGFGDSPLAFLASVSFSLHLCHFLPPSGSGFRLLFPFWFLEV